MISFRKVSVGIMNHFFLQYWQLINVFSFLRWCSIKRGDDVNAMCSPCNSANWGIATSACENWGYSRINLRKSEWQESPSFRLIPRWNRVFLGMYPLLVRRKFHVGKPEGCSFDERRFGSRRSTINSEQLLRDVTEHSIPTTNNRMFFLLPSILSTSVAAFKGPSH